MIKSFLSKVLQKDSTRHISAMGLQRVLQIGLGFLSSIIVIRYLGPEQFGQLSYIMAIMFILTPFYSFGVDDFLLRDLVKEDRSDIVLAGFYVKLTSFLLVSGTVLLYYFLIRPPNGLIIVVYSLLMLFRTFDVFEVYLSAKSEFNRMSQIRAFVTVILFSLKLVGVWKGLGWEFFLLISALEIVLVGTGFFLLYLYKNPHSLGRIFSVKWSMYSRYIKLSIPVLFVLIVDFSLMRIDQVMVEYFTSKIELGVYSAGVKIIEVIKFIPIIFLTAILPEIVNSFDKGTEETEAKTAYLHGIQFLFCISVLFFVLLFGDYMINLLYGETFAESALVVKLYSFLMIISIFSSTRNKLLIVKNSSKVVLWFSLLVLSMNIVFNIVFIQRYGTVGAIWGSILSYILATFIFLFSKSYRRESLLPFSYLLKKMRNN